MCGFRTFPLSNNISNALTTTPGIKSPGSWLLFLLGLVSVLGQESEQVGVVRAGQDALAIQGVFADDVGEGGRGLVCRICSDGFPDGVGQGLAGAARYVVVYGHGFRDRIRKYHSTDYAAREGGGFLLSCLGSMWYNSGKSGNGGCLCS